MADLRLEVRLDGYADPAGVLTRDGRGALSFEYTSTHLDHPTTSALSLSLPLIDEPFADPVTRAFFDNLLQERDAPLAAVMAREGLARDDVAGLLLHLGKECPGALSVVPLGAPPVKLPGDFGRDYDILSEDRLIEIVSALHDRRALPMGMADPSPLAGVQSKIALTLLPGGQFAEPKPGSGAPTTHILKVPDRGHRRDARLEATAMGLSRAVSLDTAGAVHVEMGAIPVLLIERFDRALNSNGHIIRLHVEDFAQALGLPAALKYERHGIPGRRFDVTAIRTLIDKMIDPVAERVRFIRSTLFDLLVGNTDAHAKNHGLIHFGGGRVASSPRYDVLPTRLDPQLTDELPFKIGAADRLAVVTHEDLVAFMSALGIANAAAQRRVLRQSLGGLADTLGAALDELDRMGMRDFADLIATNIRHLLPIAGLPVPPGAAARDAYVQRGGGWATS